MPVAPDEIIGHIVLDMLDDLSNHGDMSLPSLTWAIVDAIGDELGARPDARRKWRQRGVPSAWRIKIAQSLLARGVPVALADFDGLEILPGRIAA